MPLLQRLKAARLFWPAAMTAAALPILVGLGTWQLQRKGWKDGLIAAIEARSKGTPAPLDALLASASADNQKTAGGALEYARVALRGHFLHAHERYLYGLDERLGPGEHVYTPLETADGLWLVLVNRGFVTGDRKLPASRPEGQIDGEVPVVGLVRGGEAKGAFDAANDPARNRWFYRDIPAMAAGVPLSPGRKLAPVVVEVEAAPPPPGGWPRGGVTRLALSNRHLEYALTWYGLAAALIAVFGMFAADRLKSSGSEHPPSPPR